MKLLYHGMYDEIDHIHVSTIWTCVIESNEDKKNKPNGLKGKWMSELCHLVSLCLSFSCFFEINIYM